MSSPKHEQQDCAPLPKPIALTADQLQQVAAGTALLLPIATLRPIIAGPYPVGPIWASATAAE
ncbi:MAG: hypothetical protein JO001_16370 [Alphaproteobacteria bacterium]|nr:hypothetical protein [Alphaproteobacteria bacterium]